MYFGAEKIMGLFTSQEDAQVVTLGKSYLHLVSWMYILPAITNGIQDFFRGMGDLKVTLYPVLYEYGRTCVGSHL